MPCQSLPQVRSGKLQALMENHIETTHRYHECAERHEALAAVVRTMQRHSHAPVERRTQEQDEPAAEQDE
nr:MAG TPA: hypothetical protein [Caudoviricetes sp.]